jgi:AbrB family looped-hinge helix DNA binding protein
MNSNSSSKNLSNDAVSRIGPKHQVTIPGSVFEHLKLKVGEYLEVSAKDNRIVMTPKKLVSKDQAWFYTPEWQKKEAEADKDIAEGNLDGPFDSIKDLTAYLQGLKQK